MTATATRARSALFALGAAALMLVWVFTLRPQALGGPAGYVMVRGTSMLPTFDPGDLVVVRPQSAYATGDVVAYRVPDGDTGQGIIVIHRIVGGDVTAGFVLKGDNNDALDEWHPKQRDIVGKPWLHLSHAGDMLAFTHSPLPLASLAAGIAVAVVVVPPKRTSRPSRRRAG